MGAAPENGVATAGLSAEERRRLKEKEKWNRRKQAKKAAKKQQQAAKQQQQEELKEGPQANGKSGTAPLPQLSATPAH